MELRQNIYYLILYAVVSGFILLASIAMYVYISQMNENLDVYKEVLNVISLATDSYLTENYYVIESSVLSLKECYTRYEGKTGIYVYCNGEKIPFSKVSFPFYLNIHKGNEKIYVERGSYDYGVIKYLYVMATNKRMVFIRIQSSKYNEFEDILLSFYNALPQSSMVGFYDKDSYVIVCMEDDLRMCDKTDFLSYYLLSGSTKEFMDDLNDVLEGNNKIDVPSQPNDIMKEEIMQEYLSYDPLFFAFVDDESQCMEWEECVEVRNTGIFYVWSDGEEKKEIVVSNAHEIIINSFFKNHYGFYDGEMYYLYEDSYLGTFLDYLEVYSPILSTRYSLLAQKKKYSRESYNICKDLFNEVSSLLGCDGGVCSIVRSNKVNLNALYEKLNKVKELSRQIYAKGCEERIYL